MGLDMYLRRHSYVKNWEHQKPEEKHKITVKKDNKIRKDIKPERISYVVEEVAYWRKFNALHNWFIQNCADGEDNCRPVYVEKSNFVELLNNLRQVKESLDKSPKKMVSVASGWANGEKTFEDVEVFEDTSVAEELLGTASGCFFGSTDYDKWYYDDVVKTIAIIEEVVADETGDYYYEASW
jgi:hypothetical protein